MPKNLPKNLSKKNRNAGKSRLLRKTEQLLIRQGKLTSSGGPARPQSIFDVFKSVIKKKKARSRRLRNIK